MYMRAHKLLQNASFQPKKKKRKTKTLDLVNFSDKQKWKAQILLQRRNIDSVIGYFNQAATSLEGNASHGRETDSLLEWRSLWRIWNIVRLRLQGQSLAWKKWVMQWKQDLDIPFLCSERPLVSQFCSQTCISMRFMLDSLKYKSRKQIKINSLSKVELSRHPALPRILSPASPRLILFISESICSFKRFFFFETCFVSIPFLPSWSS